MRPKLPIDEMTDEQFRRFKEEYLDGDFLSEDALAEIAGIFDVGSPRTGTLYCDGDHSDVYWDVRFFRPDVGVVHRLVEEVRRHGAALDEIRRVARLENEKLGLEGRLVVEPENFDALTFGDLDVGDRYIEFPSLGDYGLEHCVFEKMREICVSSNVYNARRCKDKEAFYVQDSDLVIRLK